MSNTLTAKQRRHIRVRTRVNGTPGRPRLSVRITLNHIIAQVVDDTQGITLAYVTTIGQDTKGTMIERASWVGKQLALQAKDKKITKVVFDRGSRLYHGRLHALAEAARQSGLEF